MGDLGDEPVRSFSKEAQLARSGRRYHRKVASPKRWQAIFESKQGPCKSCNASPPNELHHVISRAHGGSDTESNLVPLCRECHALVTGRDQPTIRSLLVNLSNEEYSYAVEHGGENFFEVAYGLRYERVS